MTYVGIGLRRSEKLLQTMFLFVRFFVFAFQALSSPAPKSFLHAGTSSVVTHPGASPSSLSLPLEVPLVAHSVHASSLLSPRFIRALGIQKLLSCGRLLLPDLSLLVLPPHLCTPREVMGWESLRGLSLFSVASPASSLHALRGGEAGESNEFRSS